jgi:hypothetical protein
LNRFPKIIAVLLLIVCAPAAAQSYDDDAKLWLNVNIGKQITKKWESQLLLQNRLSENFSRYSGYVCGSVAYRVTRNFKILTGYTIGSRQDNELIYTTVQQFIAGVMLRIKFREFTFIYRNLAQWQANGVSLFDDEKTVQGYNRNKLTIRYDLEKRWQVYAAGELYFPLNLSYKYDYIARSKSTAGVVYKISKHSSLEAYFLLQLHNNYTKMSARDFIYGLTYNIEI